MEQSPIIRQYLDLDGGKQNGDQAEVKRWILKQRLST